MSKIIFILLLIYIQYLVFESSNYSIIKSECKKSNGNCFNCKCFLCPRYKIIYKDLDDEFINNLKNKFKNLFKLHK